MPDPGIRRTFASGGLIIDKESAESFAGGLYDRLVQASPSPRIDRPSFVAAVRELASSGTDHGELDDAPFQRLIDEGLVREQFGLNKNQRRLDTSANAAPNWPPARSIFHGKLLGHVRQTHDFSYAELRDIVARFVAAHPMEEAAFDEAIKVGIDQFQAGATSLRVDPAYDADLQLLVQHLLAYQNFNLGPLRQTSENAPENAARANELEKSKWMFQQRPFQNLDRLVPPDPSWQGKESVSHAFGALIDVNRPVPGSILGAETYKAVFLQARRLYRAAFEQAQAAVEDDRPSPPLSPAERFRRQRAQFNPLLFGMIGSSGADRKVVPPVAGEEAIDDDANGFNEVDAAPVLAPDASATRGRRFFTETLRVPFDEEAQSFDEDENFESDDEVPSSDDVYDGSDTLAVADAKRKRTLSSIGLLAKVSNQKALIDEPGEATSAKHGRMRHRIERQAHKVDARYGRRFNQIAKQDKKHRDLRKRITKSRNDIKEELAVLQFLVDEKAAHTGMSKKLRAIEGRAATIPLAADIVAFNDATTGLKGGSKEYTAQLNAFRKGVIEDRAKRREVEAKVRQLKRAKRRSTRLSKRFDEFYETSPIEDFADKDARTLAKERPKIFGRVAPKRMREYLFAEPDRKRRRKDSSEDDAQAMDADDQPSKQQKLKKKKKSSDRAEQVGERPAPERAPSKPKDSTPKAKASLPLAPRPKNLTSKAPAQRERPVIDLDTWADADATRLSTGDRIRIVRHEYDISETVFRLIADYNPAEHEYPDIGLYVERA